MGSTKIMRSKIAGVCLKCCLCLCCPMMNDGSVAQWRPFVLVFLEDFPLESTNQKRMPVLPWKCTGHLGCGEPSNVSTRRIGDRGERWLQRGSPPDVALL